MNRPSCSTCAHCTTTNPNSGAHGGPVALGGPKQMYCRRFPPTIIPIQTNQGLQVLHAVPVVSNEDWCGEHKPDLRLATG